MRLRELIGSTLRRHRQAQGRTLREVAAGAGVSLTYLSEVERGRKEASSEVLEAICAALDLVLSDVLFEVAEALVRLETGVVAPTVGSRTTPARPVPARAAAPAATEAPHARVLDFQAFAGRRAG